MLWMISGIGKNSNDKYIPKSATINDNYQRSARSALGIFFLL